MTVTDKHDKKTKPAKSLKETIESAPIEPDDILAACKSLDLAHAFENKPPPLDFVVSGLKAGTVAILASPGGVGKSILSIEIAMAVAAIGADKALLDLGVKSFGPVLMLNAEDPADVLEERIHNIGMFLDDETRAAVVAQLEMKALRGARPNLLDPKWVDAISRVCEHKRLLVIDTFSRFHSGDENSNQEMGAVIAACELITERTGVALVGLHHTAKAATLNGQQASQQSTRGASAIVDNARWQAYLQGMDPKEAVALLSSDNAFLRNHFVQFGIAKQNYGRPTSPKWLVKLDGGVLHAVKEGVEMQDACAHLRRMIQDESMARHIIAANDPLASVLGAH